MTSAASRALRSPKGCWAWVACLLVAGAGCAKSTDKLVQVPPPGFRQDVFPQDAASQVDILWVIDNSGSMAPRQQALANSLSGFMDLLSRGLVDYRIAVTTTDVFNDKGAFVGNPPIITPSDADPVAEFQKSVKVGILGNGHEEAFAAAQMALEQAQTDEQPVLAKLSACNSGCGSDAVCLSNCSTQYAPPFMRPAAHLYLVFVSDEDEQSFGDVLYYQRYFQGVLGVGNEGSVSVAVICGDVPTPPCAVNGDPQPGTRFLALEQAVGGIFGSICNADWDAQLDEIALDVVNLKRKFGLAEVPDLSSLTLTVKYRCDTPQAQMGTCTALEDDCAGQAPEALGFLCTPPQSETDGWSYEQATNSVFFDGASVPGLRSVLVVSYQSANGS